MRLRRKTLLIGYVGKSNFGDDMMVEAVRSIIGAERCETISAGISIWRLFRLLLTARQIVICGGHIIGARHGSYLRVLTLAKLLLVKRIFFSIEASGWPKGRQGFLQRYVMRGAFVATRTSASSLILSRHVPGLRCISVTDVFYLHQAMVGDTSDVQIDRFRISTTQSEGHRVVVLPRTFGASPPYTNAENISRILSILGQLSDTTTIDLAPSAGVDDVSELSERLSAAGYSPRALGIADTILLDPATVVITNRLHISKLCAFFDVPHHLVSYDKKTERPEIIGKVGEILQLDGQIIRIADVAVDPEEFALRNRMSRNCLELEAKR